MSTEMVTTVYKTDDLSIFKVLEGNRDIQDARLKKIKISIEKNGYIHCPIIVNEKMEVIDGQGRLEALRQLGMPVEFIVYEGLGVKDCVVLNVNSTNWSLLDYIESYAERGYRSYQYLLHLIKKYNELNAPICISAISEHFNSGKNNSSAKIKNGEFTCSGEQYERADRVLEYFMRFLKTIKNFPKGDIRFISSAIMFTYMLDDVDKEKLINKFERYYGMDDIPKFIDVDGALKVLTMIYNRRNQQNKIYFEVEYDKYQIRKSKAYATRWSKGYAKQQEMQYQTN